MYRHWSFTPFKLRLHQIIKFLCVQQIRESLFQRNCIFMWKETFEIRTYVRRVVRREFLPSTSYLLNAEKSIIMYTVITIEKSILYMSLMVCMKIKKCNYVPIPNKTQKVHQVVNYNIEGQTYLTYVDVVLIIRHSLSYFFFHLKYT